MIPSVNILTAFKTSKYGSKASNCADSFAISSDGLKLAVADGVSKSYLPRLVAQALTDYYVNKEIAPEEVFNDRNATELLSAVIAFWQAESEKFEKSVDEDTAYDLEYQRELYGMGASTFAGITLQSDRYSFDVLGDSCIFLIPRNEEENPSLLTSMPARVDTGQEHPFICDFGVHPHFLDTNGRIVGEALAGSVKPFDGFIILATDAMADWICRHYTRENGLQLIQTFMELGTQEEFDNYINQLRDADLKNDDVALVIAEVKLDQFAQSVQSVQSAQLVPLALLVPSAQLVKLVQLAQLETPPVINREIPEETPHSESPKRQSPFSTLKKWLGLD